MRLICEEPHCPSEGVIKEVDNAGKPAPKVIVWAVEDLRDDAPTNGLRVEALPSVLPKHCPLHRRR